MNPSIPSLVGATGLLVAFIILRRILKLPEGEGKVQHIAQQIQAGAMVFMRREFVLISFFAILIGFMLYFFQMPEYGAYQALAFFFGCLASSFTGYLGMFTATRANVRTTIAARDHGQTAALNVAFFGGSVMGLTVASMGLIGLGGLYFVFQDNAHLVEILEGFAMGASLVALFYRVGGGIFTKAADVGADLVGKVEAGIPEDDPRNPGVIADNVGDNVGDVAGMGSDIFESYCGAQIASIAIAGALGVAAATELGATPAQLMFLPIALTTIGLVCSILGILLVRMMSANKPANALRAGTIGAALIFIGGTFGFVHLQGYSLKIALAVLCGSFGGVIIGLVTEYFTAGRPVRQIAKSGSTGVATVMISGLSVGMKSVAVPLLTLAATVFISFEFAGLYGVGLAAVGMLGTVGMTMAIDAYGPIADNAGGIAEMSAMGPETRRITDGLDSVGNTTAAIGKGFAIGAAGLAALALITAFIKKTGVGEGFNLADESVLSVFFTGLFIGGVIPFLNGSITMDAVGGAAFEMINEIRRQFHKIPGLLEGLAEPDSEKCIDIATQAATRRMILPAALAVGTPLVVGFGFNVVGGPGTGATALTGTLCGSLLGCILLALFMSNAGGAWDNAKKYVEEGNFGGKNSETHKGCVVGDTVGDPFKDTSGPSMNILINVMSIVSLVIAPLL
jgi:K(+)-stimulated pyrophosphate-energized sodium pump